MRCWPSGSIAGGICAVPLGLRDVFVPEALTSYRCSSARSLLFLRVRAVTPVADSADSAGHGFRKKALPDRARKQMRTSGPQTGAWEWQGSGGFLPSLFASALCILLSLLPVSDAVAEQSKNAEASKQFGASVPSDTFENVPQTLSGGDKARRIQRPKSAQAESCTRKCVSTCIRGGAGAPGEGPLNVRRPLVVFKEGFRSRQYCLLECSEICNLIPDGQDGP